MPAPQPLDIACGRSDGIANGSSVFSGRSVVASQELILILFAARSDPDCYRRVRRQIFTWQPTLPNWLARFGSGRIERLMQCSNSAPRPAHKCARAGEGRQKPQRPISRLKHCPQHALRKCADPKAAFDRGSRRRSSPRGQAEDQALRNQAQ
jgi:hypothetical protein